MNDDRTESEEPRKSTGKMHGKAWICDITKNTVLQKLRLRFDDLRAREQLQSGVIGLRYPSESVSKRLDEVRFDTELLGELAEGAAPNGEACGVALVTELQRSLNGGLR